MRHPFRALRILPLVIMALLLAACGSESDTDADSAANSTSNSPAGDVAQSSPSRITDTSSTPEPPVTLVPTDPETTGSSDVPDNPWGKEIPTGPAPTVPPNPPSDFDKDGDGMYTNEEFAEAIRYRFSEYEWPDNYQTTADRIIDSLNQDAHPNALNEAPAEYTIIGMFHQCAWQYALIDAAHDNDQALIDESQYQLVEIGQNKNPLARDENGKKFMRDAYDRAALGDTAQLQQIIDGDCRQRKKDLIPAGSNTCRVARHGPGGTVRRDHRSIDC